MLWIREKKKEIEKGSISQRASKGMLCVTINIVAQLKRKWQQFDCEELKRASAIQSQSMEHNHSGPTCPDKYFGR